MKKIISHLAALLLLLTTSMPVMAQAGSTCDNAIYVDAEYTNTFRAGEYWFTAMTSALPMTINCYPTVAGQQAPQIQVDFTCTFVDGQAVYDDPKVASMVQRAGDYGLYLPMINTLRAKTDENGKIYYTYTFPSNYNEMLYGQGVTYAIPAYVKLTCYSNIELNITSGSVHSRCRDYVNQLGMNTSFLFTPEDSINTYVWPLGEWSDKQYEITWEGADENSRLLFLTSKDCDFDRFSAKVRGRYNLPAVDEDHALKMTPEATADVIDDIAQPELYVHMYANSEGYLKIHTYEINDNLTDYIVGGVPAVVDNEAMTITAVLPAGTDRAAAIKAARYRPLTTHDGHQAEYDEPYYTTLYFGSLQYDLSGIVVAQSTGNTDASLKSLSIDGAAIPGFSPAVTDYYDIEVPDGQIPTVAAEARKSTSTVEIKQAKSIPGTAVITVTAEAGNTQTYTINFIKQRSKDNSLAALYVDGKLIDNFSASTYNYRLVVTSLPTITATLNDEKATMEIDQPKHIPGFGQVMVTAESGDVALYTINFVLDEEVRQCANTITQMNASQAYTVTDGDLLRVSANEWAGKNVMITWSGNEDLNIDMLPNCLEGENHPFAQYSVAFNPEGIERRCYLTAAQTQTWMRNAVNGYVYLRFNTSEIGQASIAPYTPTCLTQSKLIDIKSETVMPANGFTQVYTIYLPDWQHKDIKVSWEGESSIELFFANDCNIYLTNTDEHILQNGNQIMARKGSFTVTQDMAKVWLQTSSGDFAYLRVLNEGEGVMTVSVTKEYDITGINEAQDDAQQNAKPYKILLNGQIVIVLPNGKMIDVLGNEIR